MNINEEIAKLNKEISDLKFRLKTLEEDNYCYDPDEEEEEMEDAGNIDAMDCNPFWMDNL